MWNKIFDKEMNLLYCDETGGKSHIDTDSKDFILDLASALSSLVVLHNTKLVFDKDGPIVKPLDKYKLGGTAYRNVLYMLDRQGEMKMSELADAINYDRGNMTKLIDYVVELGFVNRFRKEGDRRTVYVALTESGNKLLDDESNAFVDNMREKAKALSADQKIELFNSLNKAIKIMKLL